MELMYVDMLFFMYIDGDDIVKEVLVFCIKVCLLEYWLVELEKVMFLGGKFVVEKKMLVEGGSFKKLLMDNIGIVFVFDVDDFK